MRLLKLGTAEYYTGMKSKGAKLYLVHSIPFPIYQVGERKTDFRVVEKYCFIWFLVYIPHVFLHVESLEA